jgi:hypothetical protein
MTKKQSFAAAARSIVPVPEALSDPLPSPSSAARRPPAVEYRKFTVPLRSDQLNDITQTLARLVIERDVVITKALLIRLAIDEMLAKLQAAPDDVIQQLHELEQRELSATLERKPLRKSASVQ